jgi:hypothetical protein
MVVLLTPGGCAIIDVRRMSSGLEEVIMEANASILQGWEIDHAIASVLHLARHLTLHLSRTGIRNPKAR